MPLVKCPHCNKVVSSVASACPHCHQPMAAKRVSGPHDPVTIECHKCRVRIPATSSVCCNCGVLEPHDRRRLLSGRTALVAGLTLAVGYFGWGEISRMTSKTESPTPILTEVLGANPSTDSITRTPEPDPMPLPQPPATAVEPSPLAVAHEPPAEEESTEVRWTADWVNVREGEGIDTPVVKVLEPGQEVRVVNPGSRWWPVFDNGQQIGFVSRAVLLATAPSFDASGPFPPNDR